MTETDIMNKPLNSARPAEVDSCGCAFFQENIDSPTKSECPQSGTLSQNVLHETLENLFVQYK